jgi:tRNA threonylcarbamoyladenosine modification (KEOPS) complex  Pcc1 subunit
VAAKYDIVMDQGATFSRAITWQDSQAVPVNLTGYTARMQVRDEVDSSTSALSLTTENSRISLGGAAGTIALLVSATDTAAVAAGEYVYDLELVSGSGTVTRLIQGCFTVDAEVTR